MSRVLTLAWKDIKLLLGDKAGLFWVVGFPLLYAIFFGAIFSGTGSRVSGMKLIVVDQDRTEKSQQFVRQLTDSPSLRVSTMPADSAHNMVRRGKASAYLVIPPGYGGATGFGPGGSSELELGIDPARKAEIGYLQGLIMQSSFKQLQQQWTDPTAMRSQLQESIYLIDQDTTSPEKDLATVKGLLTSLDRFYSEIDTAVQTDTLEEAETGDAFFSGPKIKIASVTDDRVQPKSSYEITFPLSILWGLLSCAATFAISIVQERVHGTYLRLLIAPINRAHVLAGKGVACFITCLVVCLFMLVLGHFIFGVSIDQPVKMALAIFATVFCFVGLMMIISVMGKTEQSVGGVGWAVMLVFAMLGGGMIPLIFMPSWMQTISSVSPFKWGILAIEGAVWRNFSYSEMVLPVAVLLLIGAGCFAAGVMILSRYDK